jgi:trans-aconitate 2-methyltransferase
MPDWNAAVYQRVSDPQYRWGMRILDAMQFRGDETALDVGCGTGRLTAELLQHLPRGRVLAIDASENMLAEARKQLAEYGDRVTFIHADVLPLDLDGVADLIFSTATFHWIHDHAKLFRVLYRALKPEGRLVAQCGGGPNLYLIHEHGNDVAKDPKFAPYFRDWRDPWNFPMPEETTAKLRLAGFTSVEVWLQPEPTVFNDAASFREFVATVALRTYIAKLPDEKLREEFLDRVLVRAAKDDPPFTLDYWRLNIRAAKAAASASAYHFQQVR